MKLLRHSVLCALLLTTGVSYAASLKVAPAQFIVHDVAPGTVYDIYEETGLRLSVYNDDDVARTWVLSAHRPSERGRWERGYGEIPDAKWCWFDKSEITVGPNSRGYAQLFLRVPEEEQYYNQHWVVTLGVRAKSGTSFIGLGIDVRVQIETKSKEDAVDPPYGALGLVPSAVQMNRVRAGETVERNVVLYNNDSEVRVYTVGALFDMEDIDHKSYLSKGYLEIPDGAWLSAPKSISIGARGIGVMNLQVAVPEGAAHLGKKWEHIVYIEPDQGRAEFVRVQIDMVEESTEETTRK